jgi:hypothetical protein
MWLFLPGARPSIDAEAVFRRARKALARTQHSAWKGRLVRRIREVLRFKGKTRVAAVDLTSRSAQRPVKMIAAIELKSWLGRVHFENASVARFTRASGKPWLAASGRPENETVIIPKGSHELLIPLADAGADRVRLPEVEGRVCDVSGLPGRNEVIVDRREALSG